MSSAYREKVRGIRKASPVVTVAAAATPEVLYIQSPNGQNPRIFCIRKVMAELNVNCQVTIGTGLGGLFAAILPPFDVVGGFLNVWEEDEIVEVWVNANLTVQSSILGVQIMCELEEVE